MTLNTSIFDTNIISYLEYFVHERVRIIFIENCIVI